MVQNWLTADDFNRILDNYYGRQISHTPVTETNDNISGGQTLTSGSPVNIKAHFVKTGQFFNFEKHGLTEQGDAIALTKVSDSVSKNDLLTVNGEVFRVKEAYDVAGVTDSTGSGSEYIYTVCNLFRES